MNSCDYPERALPRINGSQDNNHEKVWTEEIVSTGIRIVSGIYGDYGSYSTGIRSNWNQNERFLLRSSVTRTLVGDACKGSVPRFVPEVSEAKAGLSSRNLSFFRSVSLWVNPASTNPVVMRMTGDDGAAA